MTRDQIGSPTNPFIPEMYLTFLVLHRMVAEEEITHPEAVNLVIDLGERLTPLLSSAERIKIKQRFADEFVSHGDIQLR